MDPLILVVDDMPENIQVVVKLLNEMGIKKIHSAPNGKVGYELAKKSKPALILSDWQMPVMDGREMVKLIKNDDQIADIPIIFISANRTNAQDIETSFSDGVHDYIKKPFDPLEFKARVQNTLRLRSVENRLREKNALVESQNKELQTSNEKMQKLSDAKVRYFQDVTHDLKSPISALLGMVEVLNHSYGDDMSDEVKDFLEKIEACGKKLNQLSEEIRELINLEEGFGVLDLKETDIHFLLKGVVNILSNLATKKQSEIVIENVANSGTISADGKKLEKVFFNIITNAIQYSHKGEKVKVKLHEDESCLIVDIADKGPGIPEHMQSIIFDRFQTTNEEGKSNRVGLGIGLSLSNEIVKLHNGRLEVKSDDHGTVFSISLPKSPST